MAEHCDGCTCTPPPFTEVDRKEATARLDAYLEWVPRQGRARTPAEDIAIAAILDVEPLWPDVGAHIDGQRVLGVWVDEGPIVLKPRAHDVEVDPCPCGFAGCPIQYHLCTVCGITTMVPPPLPCPGPRKDT